MTITDTAGSRAGRAHHFRGRKINPIPRRSIFKILSSPLIGRAPRPFDSSNRSPRRLSLLLFLPAALALVRASPPTPLAGPGDEEGAPATSGAVEVEHDDDDRRPGPAPVAPPPGDAASEADENDDDDDDGAAIIDGDANEAIPDDVPAAEEEETGESKDELEEDEIVPTDELTRLIKAGKYEEILAYNEEREWQNKEEKEKEEARRREGERKRRAIADREKYERRNRAQAAAWDAEEVAKERERLQQRQPTSQPSIGTVAYEYRYEQLYDDLFQPQMEEYALAKFDPYSLSGAPLGGWGRATRSRLATLPMRLVSDFDGGFDLWYDSEGDDDGEDDDVSKQSAEEGGETNEPESKGTAEKNADAKSGVEDKASTAIAKGVRRSTGPHISVHDATGQRYVCRSYAEDELTVLSRVDSLFHPAIHVRGAEPRGEKPGNADAKHVATDEDALKRLEEYEKEMKEGKKEIQISFRGNGVASGDGNNGGGGVPPDGVRSSVAGMLRRMGLNDAAAALTGGHHGMENVGGGGDVEVEVDVVVLDVELQGDGADEGGGDNAELADIIKAAAIGAGVGPFGAKKEGDGDENSDGGDGGSKKEPGTPAQLTPERIYELLSKLKGLCAQLHLGWWSYEWCHRQHVRQFHLHQVNEPDRKYDVRDVTLVGKFGHEHDGAQIIYPAGEYDGEYKKGTTQSVVYGTYGKVLRIATSTHTPHEDEKYSQHVVPVLKELEDKELKEKAASPSKRKKRAEGHERGPIVVQKFEGGNFCPEVNHNRHMYVEMMCCTEKEIDHLWRVKQQVVKKGEKAPLALLLEVIEDKTCVYRSRVCTPLLCPESAVARATNSNGAGSTAKSTSTTTNKDPMGSLLSALLGEEMALDNFGQVQVFFPNAAVGREFNELIRTAQDGGDFLNHPSFDRVKNALRKSGKKMDLFGNDEDASKDGGRSSPVEDVKDGTSIREILGKTLGRRPCLLKNLGWWTYEFCYGKYIRQYHSNNLIDSNTGFSKQVLESEHQLGKYENSGNSVEDYPNEDEHLHVVNATDPNKANGGIGGAAAHGVRPGNNEKRPGGNGAVYLQEYSHGDTCDQEDVAESVIKGGNVVHGSVERSTTIRFSCGKRSQLMDVKEDSTCHYILDVTVPELCHHRLFRAEVTKTQVVKCLPV